MQTTLRSDLGSDPVMCRLARECVAARRLLVAHGLLALGVLGLLLVCNLLVSPGYLWVIWLAGAWGLGLALHALVVFGFSSRPEEW